MSTRRQFLHLGSLAMLTPWLVCAQARPLRIGLLSARPLAESFYAGGVVKRLEELGYRTYEFRSADRVLKGTKPGAIPVEQADEFDLAINGRTARMLAIKIPESVLARATRIIN